MPAIVSGRGPGRPRLFDVETALALGQAMFHEHGYAGVGLASLTDRLAIRPPSFYAAFGSKAGYFKRILDRYVATVLPLNEVLLPGRPPAEALADLLERAARTYAADPRARGCLVLEAARSCPDTESAVLARRTTERKRAELRAFVAASHPSIADQATDVVTSTLSGLSACAREGWGVDRLIPVARTAATGLRALLEVGPSV